MIKWIKNIILIPFSLFVFILIILYVGIDE
jgi:hypothetical protein